MGTVGVPFEIDASGGVDVTSALTRFLNGVPNGTRIDFPSNGRFRVDRTLDVVDKFGLHIRGHGSRLFTDDATTYVGRQHLLFTGGGDLTLDGLHVRGPHELAGKTGVFDVTREHQHALQTRGVHGMCILGCELSHVFGDLVYLKGRKVGPSGTATGNEWSSDIWLSGMSLHHSGRQGVTFQGVSDAVVCRSEIFETRRSTFEIEPLTAAFNGAQRVTIEDNQIGAGRLALLSVHGSGPVSDITLDRNRLTRSLGVTVHDNTGARTRARFRIVDNVSQPTAAEVQNIGSTGGQVMDFTNVDGVHVRGNTQPVQAGRQMAFVAATGCTDVDVSANDCYEVNRFGARSQDCPQLRTP